MEVLFVTPGFGTDRNVGFAPIVATALAERGHEVRAFQYRSEPTLEELSVDYLPVSTVATPHWVGQWLLYRRLERELARVISNHPPDVVVADRMAMVPAIAAAEGIDVPAIGVIPGLGFMRFDPWNLDRDKTPTLAAAPRNVLVQYPFVQSLFRQQRRAIRNATEVVVISEFLQGVMDETFERETTLVRTPVPLEEVTADHHEPERLTLVNPRTELKGADVFAALVEAYDEFEFLVAGEFADDETTRRFARMENVEHLGWVRDMRTVYARTKLVIVPSLVEEGGGPRVVIEGFANGIPAVGTTRGAIPEHIDGAGKLVSDPYDVDEWGVRIDDAIAEYEQLASVARRRAALFDEDRQVERFLTVIERATA